jgi:hypothetical protein
MVMILRVLWLFVIISALSLRAQTIYSENFSGLSLTGYTATNSTGQYAAAPVGFYVINDGRYNNVGSTLNPNTPFNAAALKTAGWVVGYSSQEQDTFLVSTSWLDTATNSVNRWIVTPTVALSGINLALKWKAKAPDALFKDGYEVYFTTSTASVLTSADFPQANRLFFINDNNTAGAGESNGWTARSAFLDNLSGQTVRFAFRNNSKDRFQLWLDDIEVSNTSYNRNVVITTTEAGKYILTNTQDSVRFMFANLGATSVFSITTNYMVGNSAIQSQQFTSALGWGSGSLNKLKFNIPYALTSPGLYKIKTWVSALNGLADQDVSNDTAVTYVSALSTAVPKMVLAEQFLSANDGDSPDAMEKLLSLQSNTAVIGVNIHTNDNLSFAATSSLVADFKEEFSTALFDRSYFSDSERPDFFPAAYKTRSNRRLLAVSPVSVSVVNKTFNSATNELRFTVKADFAGGAIGQFRLGAYLTENQVYGNPSDTTVNGYNQLNSFYHVPWSPYYQKGYFNSSAGAYVMSAWHYRHQGVLTHVFDDLYGTPASVTSTLISAGQTFQQTYSVIIPPVGSPNALNRIDNMYIVAFLAEAGSDKIARSVLNATREKITTTPEVVSVQEERGNMPFVTIYPNPASETVLLTKTDDLPATFVVRDLQGRVLYQGGISGTEIALDVRSLQNGVYFVELFSEKHKRIKKLIVQHP